jgi:hypothetical protein
MKKLLVALMCIVMFACHQPQEKCAGRQTKVEKSMTPLMGWASWNNYRIHINEDIIKSQADAMVDLKLTEAGYNQINIDDGFYGGRDAQGKIMAHPEKFPSGMKSVADYIRSKGLTPGIYADAGINTCGSHWDKDTIGVGMGLYGHDRSDLTQYLDEWGYDFIKVDWCGGKWLELDEETRYTEIARIIKEIKPNAGYNICRWAFPGKWAVQIADSWRISGDIHNSFKSIARIVELSEPLWRWCSPGHFNDMDMLQVGRGMSYEEDKTHFTMWCIMCSPLLLGNDLTQMSNETKEIITNKEIIALNQDPLCYQARRFVKNEDGTQVWAKPLVHTTSGIVAVTLYNTSDLEKEIDFDVNKVGINAELSYTMRDLWAKKDLGKSTEKVQKFKVPAHGVVVLKLKGKSNPFNVYQFTDKKNK